MTAFTGRGSTDVVADLRRELGRELVSEFSCVKSDAELEEAFLQVVRADRRKFVFVIDERDAPFRDVAYDEAAQRHYVNFLRLLFKNANFTAEAVAAAYITGILPIKRYGTQSAMTDFREFSMIDCAGYAPYVGFVESEVEALSAERGIDIAEMRRWYYGYVLPGAGHIYAPFSVMEACQRGRVGQYWTSSETFAMLRKYIDMDFEGLQGDILRAVGGEGIEVNPYKFQNDMREIHSRDDALTLLVHLGYLAFDVEAGVARIPNEEVRFELRNAVAESRHVEVAQIVRESDQLMRDILDCDEAAVAAGIQRAHDASCAPYFYNDEQALRAVVKAALISAADDYARVEELPSDHGYADVVYVPKRRSPKPALLVELKWDKPVNAAIEQVIARDYPSVLRDLEVPIVLVGVTYNVKTKEHACAIQRVEQR